MSTSTTEHRPKSISFAPQENLRQAALKKNMSVTQTYYLAHKARSKLSREAAQPDHDLRLLVGHANLLDTLMFELADAEREQERWFNQSVRGANAQKQEQRHVQWAENIAEEDEDYDSDSSDEDYYEDEDDVVMTTALTPVPSKQLPLQHHDDEEEVEDDLEEDYAQLELVRTPSHSNSPPPELVDESDSSEDELMPPSPPTTLLVLPEGKEDESESLYEEDDYYLPRRNSPTTAMVTPISVY